MKGASDGCALRVQRGEIGLKDKHFLSLSLVLSFRSRGLFQSHSAVETLFNEF